MHEISKHPTVTLPVQISFELQDTIIDLASERRKHAIKWASCDVIKSTSLHVCMDHKNKIKSQQTPTSVRRNSPFPLPKILQLQSASCLECNSFQMTIYKQQFHSDTCALSVNHKTKYDFDQEANYWNIIEGVQCSKILSSKAYYLKKCPTHHQS